MANFQLIWISMRWQLGTVKNNQEEKFLFLKYIHLAQSKGYPLWPQADAFMDGHATASSLQHSSRPFLQLLNVEGGEALTYILS